MSNGQKPEVQGVTAFTIKAKDILGELLGEALSTESLRPGLYGNLFGMSVITTPEKKPEPRVDDIF